MFCFNVTNNKIFRTISKSKKLIIMDLEKMLNVLSLMESEKVKPVKGEHVFTEEELNDENLIIPQVVKEIKKTHPSLKINTTLKSFFICTFGGDLIDVRTQNIFLRSKEKYKCIGCHRARLDILRSYTPENERNITCVGLFLRKLNNRK